MTNRRFLKASIAATLAWTIGLTMASGCDQSIPQTNASAKPPIDYRALFEKHLSEGVNHENNAAILLLQVYEPRRNAEPVVTTLEKLGASMYIDGIRQFEDMDWVYNDLKRHTPYAEEFKAAEARVRANEEASYSRPWDAAEFPEIAKQIERNEHAFDVIRQASLRTRFYYRNESMDALAFPFGGARESAQMLLSRALMRAKSDPAGSVEDIMTLVRLGRVISSRQVIVDRLTGFGIISTGYAAAHRAMPALPTEHLATLYAQLSALPPLASMEDGYRHAEKYWTLAQMPDSPAVAEKLSGAFDKVAEAMKQPTWVGVLRRDGSASGVLTKGTCAADEGETRSGWLAAYSI